MSVIKKSKDHLCCVEENYWQHLGFALHIAWVMLGGAVLAVLHALCPAVFQTSASERIFTLAEEIKERRNRKCQAPE